MKYIDVDGTQKDYFSLGTGRDKVEFRSFSGVLHFRNNKSPWYRLVGVQDASGFPDEFKVTLANDGSIDSRTQIPTSGLYEFYENAGFEFDGKVIFKSEAPSNLKLISNDPRITIVEGNVGTLNIYESTGFLTFENRLNKVLTLTIIRVNKKLEL